MRKTTDQTNLTCVSTFEYDQYMKMMCSHKGKPKVKGSMCVTFGTSQIKNFLSMKKNVSAWFHKRSQDEQGRILKFIELNC